MRPDRHPPAPLPAPLLLPAAARGGALTVSVSSFFHSKPHPSMYAQSGSDGASFREVGRFSHREERPPLVLFSRNIITCSPLNPLPLSKDVPPARSAAVAVAGVPEVGSLREIAVCVVVCPPARAGVNLSTTHLICPAYPSLAYLSTLPRLHGYCREEDIQRRAHCRVHQPRAGSRRNRGTRCLSFRSFRRRQ